MSYELLEIEQFGEHLLKSNDLDPIYVALVNSNMSRPQRNRWLLAYWCYYSAGEACFMSEQEGPAFWAALDTAARNEVLSPIGERWARGHERRHARGKQAIKMVLSLQKRYGNQPEDMVDYCLPSDLPAKDVIKRVKEHFLFGSWIAFKVADMGERVVGRKVDFDQATAFMFKDPVEAALRFWRRSTGQPDSAQPKDKSQVIHMVVDYLKDYFKDYKAPPLNDRPIDLQEVETILCKWKSHLNGKYPLFNDIDDIRRSLESWKSVCNTAVLFDNAMPKRLEVVA